MTLDNRADASGPRGTIWFASYWQIFSGWGVWTEELGWRLADRRCLRTCVGEFSITWNCPLRRWLLLHQCHHRDWAAGSRRRALSPKTRRVVYTYRCVSCGYRERYANW